MIEHKNGITQIHFFRKPTYEEIQKINDDIADNWPYDKRLWNMADLHFDFTIDEIIAISKYGKSKFIKPNKIAVVAPDDLTYGKMRQFITFREEEDHSVAGVFKTEREATEWLNK